MANSNSKLAQVKALKRGEGVQYLLNEIYKILGNPVALYDMDYRVPAYTEGIITDDPNWNDSVTKRIFDLEARQRCYRDGFMDQAANTDKCTIFTGPNLKYDIMFGKVYSGEGIRIITADLFACKKPLEDDDLKPYQAFCDILTEELGSTEYYLNYGREYCNSMINQLLADAIDNKPLHVVQIANFFEHLKTHIYVGVADISQCDPTYSKLTYYRDLLKQTQPKLLSAIHNNHIVFLVSTESKTLNVKRVLGGLYEIFKQNNIYVGISSSFENLFRLPKYYSEAVNVLNDGLKGVGDQRIFLYGKKFED